MPRQHLRRPVSKVANVVSVALALVALTVASAPPVDADARASRRDADLMKQKVVTITQLGVIPAKQLRRTTVTENEMNAYLTLDAVKDLPTGVVDPSVSILGPGRLSGRAVVDLDAVRK